jgi:hypothetical protein
VLIYEGGDNVLAGGFHQELSELELAVHFAEHSKKWVVAQLAYAREVRKWIAKSF